MDELTVPGRLLAEVVEDLYRKDRFMRANLTPEDRRGTQLASRPDAHVVNPDNAVIHRAPSLRPLGRCKPDERAALVEIIAWIRKLP
jgi:hypothetical protein